MILLKTPTICYLFDLLPIAVGPAIYVDSVYDFVENAHNLLFIWPASNCCWPSNMSVFCLRRSTTMQHDEVHICTTRSDAAPRGRMLCYEVRFCTTRHNGAARRSTHLFDVVEFCTTRYDGALWGVIAFACTSPQGQARWRHRRRRCLHVCVQYKRVGVFMLVFNARVWVALVVYVIVVVVVVVVEFRTKTSKSVLRSTMVFCELRYLQTISAICPVYNRWWPSTMLILCVCVCWKRQQFVMYLTWFTSLLAQQYLYILF